MEVPREAQAYRAGLAAFCRGGFRRRPFEWAAPLATQALNDDE